MPGSEAAPVIPSATASLRSEHDELERRIEERIRSLGRRIGWVELSWRILIWLVGVVGFLFVFSVCDQWLFSRGMPDGIRWAAWMVLAGFSAAWLGLVVGPYCLYRIHPLFAAYVLEKAVPGLKHAVMSFLLLRERRHDFEHDPLSNHVFLGLEQKAVTVETVPLDSVVDRGLIVRWAAILTGVIAAFCLYIIFSPKNVLVSTARVLIPWADIAPATRVRIENVSPGNAEITVGDRVVVTATVFGLRNGEEPRLRFSTADGQFADQVIPLQPSDGNASRFSAELFPAIPCETTYRIEAADAETKEFRISVRPAVRVELQSVELDYPSYTRLEKKTLAGMGDITAIEGTRVTVVAQSSVPLAAAEIDLDDGRTRVPMQQSGDLWQGRFTLKMSKREPNIGEFTAYRLLGQDADGRVNQDPVRFSIVTIPDRPPWAEYQDPPPDGSVIPVNAATALRAKAQDPDFGLMRLTLDMEKDGRSIHSTILWESPPSEPGTTDTVTGTFEFRPDELQLKPGDTIVCRLEAVDNREPIANRAESRRLELVIGEPAPPDQAESQKPDSNGTSSGAENPSERTDSSPSEALPQNGTESPGNDTNPSAMQNQREGPAASDSANGHPQDQAPGGPSSTEDGQSTSGDQRLPKESPERDGNSVGREGRNGMESQGTQSGSQSAGEPPAASPSGGGSQSQPQGKNTGGAGAGGNSSGASGAPSGEGDRPGDGTASPDANGQGRRNAGPGSELKAGQGDDSAGSQKSGTSSDTGIDQGAGAGPGPTAESTGEGGSIPRTSGQSSGQNNGSRPKDADSGAGRPENHAGEAGRGTGESATPADGENNPGEAFERILNYLREKGQGGTSTGSRSPDAAARQDSPDPAPNAASGSSERSDAAKPSPGSAGDNDSGQDGRQSSGEPAAGGVGDRSPPAEQSVGALTDGRNTDSAPELPSGTKDSPSGSAGREGDPRPQSDTMSQGQDAAVGSPPPPGTAPQGDSPKNGQLAGTPPQATRSPETPGTSERSSEPQAASDPSSRDSSQTQGENGGTLSGGGREGEGQSSPQAGFGAPGSQAPATEGGEAMRDPTGPETGGSRGASGTSAADPGPQQGGADSSGQAEQTAQTDQKSPRRTEHVTGERLPGSGNPTGGGLPGQGEPPPPQKSSRPESADEPNVEYARRQTDLALRYLEEELAKSTPDPELMERLGWTREEMERFAQRWRELRKKAEVPTADTNSAKEFQEVLKSLGLRPQGTELRSGRGAVDSQRGLGTPRQTAPPPQWSEQYREYLKALGKSG
ncbi:MAG: hypothetical protein ACUVTW_02805 [Thermogutta sp.]